MRLSVGIVTFLLGAALWARSQWGPRPVPRWLARLGVGMAALGVSTLAMTQAGVPWIILSISCSLIAIALIGWVVVENFRRR